MADDIQTLFGLRVRQLRERRKIAQDKFAVKAGIERAHYGEIERGEGNPTLATIAKIAAGLGVKPTVLFQFDKLEK